MASGERCRAEVWNETDSSESEGVVRRVKNMNKGKGERDGRGRGVRGRKEGRT